MVRTGELGVDPGYPIVLGEAIVLSDEVDETYGLPREVARQVSEQVLRALEDYSISPEDVVFSGYDGSDNEGHEQKIVR